MTDPTDDRSAAWAEVSARAAEVAKRRQRVRRPAVRSAAPVGLLFAATLVVALVVVVNSLGQSSPPATSVPATAPAATGTPPPSPTPSPTPLTGDPAEAAAFAASYLEARAEPREEAYKFLSDWTTSAIGGYELFLSVEGAFNAAGGERWVADDPIPLAEWPDRASLGSRLANVEETADVDRAFVVRVRFPEIDGEGSETLLLVAPQPQSWWIWLDVEPDRYGVRTYPDGCAAYGYSQRRCDAVVAWAMDELGQPAPTAVGLLPDPEPGVIRTMGFGGRVQLTLADGSQVEQTLYCGIGGGHSILCTDHPAMRLFTSTNAYTDVPCSSENGGCASPVPSAAPDAVAEARPFRLASYVADANSVGQHAVEIGRAILPNGLLSDAAATLANPTMETFLLTDGSVRLEVRPVDPSRPPFDNIYTRGWIEGTEEVAIFVVYEVTEASPGASFELTDIVVR